LHTSKRDSWLNVKYSNKGRRPTMLRSATPVIAQIVETMRVKIITSETNVGELRREKLRFRLPEE
jgi:hypothetical protein